MIAEDGSESGEDDASPTPPPPPQDSCCDSDEDSEQEPPLKKQRRSCRKVQKSEYDVLFVQSEAELDDYDEDYVQGPGRGRCSEKFKTLMREIIAASYANTWKTAKEEWDPYYVYYEYGGTCLCTHTPITEHCVIKNRWNNNVTTVGNVCIRQFNTENLNVVQPCWASLRRLSRNPAGHNAGKSLVSLAKKSKIFRQSQAKAYIALTTGRGSRSRFNRNRAGFYSEKYAEREIQNKLILYGFNPQRPQCDCGSFSPAIPCYNRRKQCFFYACWNYTGWRHQGCGFWVPAPPLTAFHFETPENSDEDENEEEEEDDYYSYVTWSGNEDWEEDFRCSKGEEQTEDAEQIAALTTTRDEEEQIIADLKDH